MVLNVHRNSKAYYGQGEVDTEVGEEGDYVFIATLSPPEWLPVLRWAAMRAILMFHNCEGQSHKTVYTDHNFWTERRATEIQLTSIILSLPRLKPTEIQSTSIILSQ